jgi:hypothetical protein
MGSETCLLRPGTDDEQLLALIREQGYSLLPPGCRFWRVPSYGRRLSIYTLVTTMNCQLLSSSGKDASL